MHPPGLPVSCAVLFLWKTAAYTRSIIILGEIYSSTTRNSVCGLKVGSVLAGRSGVLGDGVGRVLRAREARGLPPGPLSGVCADVPPGGHGLPFLSCTKVSSASPEKTSGHVSHLLPHTYVLLPHMYALLSSHFSGAAHDGFESALQHCHSSWAGPFSLRLEVKGLAADDHW